MNLENPTFIGLIPIIIGIAFAALAYALYLNLRSERSSKEMLSVGEEEIALESIEEVNPPDPSEENKIIAEETSAGDQEVPEVRESPPDTPSSSEEQIESPIEAETPAPSLESPLERDAQRQVAILLRDNKTGRLIVSIGDSEYQTSDELRYSPHWSSIEHASSDLAAWFIPGPPPKYTPQPAQYDPPQYETVASTPGSMVDQINRILERKVQETPEEDRKIQLAEGPDGSVKVLIGMEVYPINEVPYDDVSKLIREAVSEWENSS